jgi:predicted metal-dependent hydrolase
MLDADTPQLPLWSDQDRVDGWTIRQSPRARRLTVRVFHTGRVEVVAPARSSQRTVQQFIERHRSWIERKREEARRIAGPEQSFPPQSIAFHANGESWKLHVAGGRGRVLMRVASPELLSIEGDATRRQKVCDALRKWLMRHAAQSLFPQLEACAREVGVTYRRALIRRQRTRWGSCSARGTISLNCCLLFQRPEVVRYLFIHELMHTRHMNHSPRFWHEVARHCPDYRRLDRELLDGWRRVPSWVFGDIRDS